MKPPPFVYERPKTLSAATEALARWGGEAKILAGGQSLVPILNLRLASPSALIDVNGLHELTYVVRDGGAVRIGALTRQAVLERSPLVAQAVPLLAEALPNVAHAQIRNRGTIGGSAAHADPAAEVPAILVACDARLHLHSRRGKRTLAAADFLVSPMVTALEDDELITEIEFPEAPRHTGTAFLEFSRRDGDFALAGTAVRIAVDDDCRCTDAVIVLLAAGPKPARIAEAEAALVGSHANEVAGRCAEIAAAASLVRDHVDGRVAWRREVTCHLVEKAVEMAATRACAAAP